MTVSLQKVIDEANNVKTFVFEPPRPVPYISGQFAELTIHHAEPDTRGQKRWFSLSSSPTQETIEITTKFAAQSSSFKKALLKLKTGDEVDIAQPMGDFVLPKDKSRPLVFTAGGIGVTPFAGIIKWLVDTNEKRDITLIYALRYADELAFLGRFTKAKGIGLKFIPVIAEPSKNWQGQAGTLDARKIIELAGSSNKSLYFIAGPEIMVETLGKSLHDKGVPKSRIVGDYFPGYPAS